MNLLKMTQPQCLIYSAAMLLNITAEHAIRLIHHDGMKVEWPSAVGSDRLRSHSMQEIIDLCLMFDVALTPIEIRPRIAPHNWQLYSEVVPKLVWDVDAGDLRFLDRITDKAGILIGAVRGKYGHACAWNGEYVYDPRGRIYKLEEDDFHIKECWVANQIQQV